MASTLHYITPLALADTFNEWFLRSNDMIDVVNKLNVYDVDTGMGLAKYRAVDGTTKIRINIGQGPNEYAGNISGVTGHGNYGLRFLAIGAGGQTLGDVGTGAANPDVSGDPAILTLDIVGLSGGSGGESGAVVSKDDYFVFADNDHPLQLSYKVAAENMLPYAISGDHRFSGNILFDGDVTTINSSEVYIDDKVIWLATSITGDHSFGGSNDAGLEGAGFVIKGRSDTSDKEFVLDYPSSLADPSSFVSFKPNIDLNFETARALTNSAFTILAHKSAGNVELRLSSLAQLGKHYEFAAFQSGDNQSRLKIRHENTISGVSQDAISVTPLGTVQVHKLSGDVLDGGVTYENTFSWEPKSDGIPTSYSGTPNDKLLNYKWVNRKLVSQTAHGLSQGHLIKFYQNGTLTAGAGST